MQTHRQLRKATRLALPAPSPPMSRHWPWRPRADSRCNGPRPPTISPIRCSLSASREARTGGTVEKAAAIYREALSVDPRASDARTGRPGAEQSRRRTPALWANAKRRGLLAGSRRPSDGRSRATSRRGGSRRPGPRRQRPTSATCCDRNRRTPAMKQTRLTRANASDQALTAVARDSHPMAWAQAKNNLGGAYRFLARQTARASIASKRQQAYGDSLDRIHPQDASDGLGATPTAISASPLPTSAAHDRRFALIETAKYDRLSAALEELTRERAPVLWANIQTTLGIALQAPARMQRGRGVLRGSRRGVPSAFSKCAPASRCRPTGPRAQTAPRPKACRRFLDEDDDAACRSGHRRVRAGSPGIHRATDFPTEWNSVIGKPRHDAAGQGHPGDRTTKSLLRPAPSIRKCIDCNRFPATKSPAEWASAMKDIGRHPVHAGHHTQEQGRCRTIDRSFDLGARRSARARRLHEPNDASAPCANNAVRRWPFK